MKILLISPDWGFHRKGLYSRIRPSVPPIGLAYIAAYLRDRNFDVRIIDQYSSRLSDAGVMKSVGAFKPDVVGFSCITVAMEKAETLSALIKKNNPQVKIVMGNIHPTALPEETLDSGLVDFVVRGEGEITMYELAQALRDGSTFEKIEGLSYIKDGEIRHNPDRPLVKDPDIFPQPAWDLLDISYYHGVESFFEGRDQMLPVFISRGCPSKCVFCAHSTVFPFIRRRNIAKVVDEIEHNYLKYGVTCVGISDSCFPMTLKDGEEFADELIRRGLDKKIKWYFEARVDMVNTKLLKKLKTAGLVSVFYGFESGNQEVLNKSGKNILLKDAEAAMKATKAAGLKSSGFFMLGLPGDNLKTCLETIRFAKKLDPDVAVFQITIPYPGTELFYSLENHKKLRREYQLFSAWRKLVSQESGSSYHPETMTAKELQMLLRRAFMEFYLRPIKVWNNIIKGVFPLRYLPAGFIIFLGLVFQGIKSSIRAE